ncbi:PIN domain-containing protein [Curtobacterium sp. MCSS17_008]|uniref:PIN domain-containing protein n=1 Tax=Curtobacterium sp. MCSS17_008 TaxID=2175647 RepID=UPI0015E8AD73|nr:PIN domain-containing protein [Curtobacterium sp. MCSS17_008]
MLLILDANAVVSNPELQGGAWHGIKAAIADKTLTVIAPRIVAAEITAKVRANRRKVQLRGDARRAPAAVTQALQNAAAEVERWAARYDAEIWLAADGILIRDTPTISHDEVSQRAIDRHPPFDENGGGYRDALHWYTVLDIIREHPAEAVVFVSNDDGYQTSKGSHELHPKLLEEANEILTTGSIQLYRNINEFDPPQKYAGEEDRTTPDSDHLEALVAALFPDGTLHAPEIWMAFDVEEPVDADVSDPGTPELVFSHVRDLVGGGRSYRTRIRLTARVVLDWINWPDEVDASAYEELDITAEYTVDDDGFHVDEDRTHLARAPWFTPTESTRSDPTFASRAAAVKVFNDERKRQLATSIDFGQLDSTAALMARLAVPPTLANAIADLAKRGYTQSFAEMAAAQTGKMGFAGLAAARAAAVSVDFSTGPIANIAAEIARRGKTLPPSDVLAAAAAAAATVAAASQTPADETVDDTSIDAEAGAADEVNAGDSADKSDDDRTDG